MIVGASLTIPDRQQKPIYFLCQYDEPSSFEISYKVQRQFKKSRVYCVSTKHIYIYIIYIIHPSFEKVSIELTLIHQLLPVSPEPLQLGLFCQQQLCQDSPPCMRWATSWKGSVSLQLGKVTMKSEGK